MSSRFRSRRLEVARQWREKNREKIRIQEAKRYNDSRLKYLLLLGAKCVQCGENNLELLEFDHINPEDKRYAMTNIWRCSEDLILRELDKCQILCNKCHINKRVVEHGEGAQGKGGCKCDLCVEKKREYARRYNSTYIDLRRIKQID